MERQPVYIGEEIFAGYTKPQRVIKTPACPDFIEWNDKTYKIETLLSEWKDFSRKGRFNRNMSLAHKKHALISGSWGVGRFNFRVETASGRIFDIYYDREPGGGSNRKGNWVLFREWIK